ncbi:hypothetical protein [Pseudomonas fragi]|uniref:hypothetical protein n=1 Tax=Pseudomonas fragi TaxID=296 RepID=UPI00113FEB6C|nr:hypothetical protein [Pseudomonas fragi]
MLFGKKIAIKAALAATLLLSASASFAETSKDYTLSCSVSGFTGTAYVTAVKNGNLLTFATKGYKISSPASSKSRSKANLNIRAWGSTSNTTSAWANSQDNLKQDNTYRSLSLSKSIIETRLASGEVQFIFDRSGSDPRCTTKVMIPKF